MDIIGDVAFVNDVAQSSLSMGGVIGLVIGACAAGLVWAYINYVMVNKVTVSAGSTGLYESVVDGPEHKEVTEEETRVINEIGEKISEVAFHPLRARRSSSSRSTWCASSSCS